MLAEIPLRESGAVAVRESRIQPLGGVPDALEGDIETRPSLILTVSISLEGDPDSMSGVLITRKQDKICRRALKVDESIEEIGPFYLQVKR